MRSLNKPNKPVYFSMHSLTGYQESVRFIGLFGLLVYFTMHTFTGEWDCVRFIGLFGLLVYFSMRSRTGQWYSVQFIGLFGLLSCRTSSQLFCTNLLVIKVIILNIWQHWLLNCNAFIVSNNWINLCNKKWILAFFSLVFDPLFIEVCLQIGLVFWSPHLC